MSIARHVQFGDMQRRADLPESDPNHLSREVLQALFFEKNWPTIKWLGERLNESSDQVLSDLENYRAGRLVLRPEPAAASIPSTSVQPVSTADLVAALIQAGVHEHAQRPGSCDRGMSAEEYAALWPTEVTYPVGYAERYSHLLLIDQTLEPNKIKACVRVDFYVAPSNCHVQPGIPEFLFGSDGQRLKRAVIFWGYEQNLGRRVVDLRLMVTATNIPLIHWHGLWIIIQHRDGILRRHGIDLPGSSFGASCVSSINCLVAARPFFSTRLVDDKDSRYGSGFRGSEFISVP